MLGDSLVGIVGSGRHRCIYGVADIPSTLTSNPSKNIGDASNPSILVMLAVPVSPQKPQGGNASNASEYY